MTSQWLEEKIEKARRDCEVQIVETCGYLPVIPESIGSLSNLLVLYLQDNQITTLPNSLGYLSNLQELNLSGNKITHIPESIGLLL
jgi:Leucine-rich repeat (LRR) protein